MLSWQTIQSLALLFIPLLLPRALAIFRSIRQRPAATIKPLSKKTSYALAVLFASAALAFLSTLPLFSPANIFRLTQSRLQTSGGVLLTRLAALRPLTPADEALRQILDAGGLDARLMYARYGPAVVLENPLAASPSSLSLNHAYLLYALPSLLTPHLLHLLALGTATSTPSGARFRTLAILTGLALCAAELYFLANHDDRPNARSTRLNDASFPFWTHRVYRGLAVALSDGLLGWVIWLSATNRAFSLPEPPGEQIEAHARKLEGVLAKVRGVGVLRNAAARDEGLRRRAEGYWVKDGEVMRDVMEEAEVVGAQRAALQRLDAGKLGRDAEGYIERTLGRGFAGGSSQ